MEGNFTVAARSLMVEALAVKLRSHSCNRWYAIAKGVRWRAQQTANARHPPDFSANLADLDFFGRAVRSIFPSP